MANESEFIEPQDGALNEQNKSLAEDFDDFFEAWRDAATDRYLRYGDGALEDELPPPAYQPRPTDDEGLPILTEAEQALLDAYVEGQRMSEQASRNETASGGNGQGERGRECKT